MDAAAAFYLNQEVLGATVVLLLLFICILGWVIRAQHQDGKAKDATIIDLSKTVATIAQASIAANAQNAVAMAALEAALEARGRVDRGTVPTGRTDGLGCPPRARERAEGLNGLPEILRDKLEAMRDGILGRIEAIAQRMTR